MTPAMKMVAPIGLAALLAGCSSAPETQDPGIFGQLRAAVAPTIAGISGGGDPAPAQPAKDNSPEAMAARALAVNPAPLILVGLESAGNLQVMAMTGENGGMRTYMTPNEQAVITRGGMLVGTKGLGHDLAVAETDATAALIRARRSGTAPRVMRYLGGDGVERPLPLSCDVRVGGAKSFAFAGRGWTATQVTETCTGSGPSAGLSVENSYLVTAGGQIPVSRQWVGPTLGHVTIQTIRP